VGVLWLALFAEDGTSPYRGTSQPSAVDCRIAGKWWPCRASARNQWQYRLTGSIGKSSGGESFDDGDPSNAKVLRHGVSDGVCVGPSSTRAGVARRNRAGVSCGAPGSIGKCGDEYQEKNQPSRNGKRQKKGKSDRKENRAYGGAQSRRIQQLRIANDRLKNSLLYRNRVACVRADPISPAPSSPTTWCCATRHGRSRCTARQSLSKLVGEGRGPAGHFLVLPAVIGEHVSNACRHRSSGDCRRVRDVER
jgi:hypothetical protein